MQTSIAKRLNFFSQQLHLSIAQQTRQRFHGTQKSCELCAESFSDFQNILAMPENIQNPKKLAINNGSDAETLKQDAEYIATSEHAEFQGNFMN
jgi:hypothetical protein